MDQNRSPLVVHLAMTVAVVLCISGCGAGQAKQDAERVADDYFAAAGAGDISRVLKLYDTAFYRVISRDKWAESYAHIRQKLGKPIQHSLQTWYVMNTVGTSESGTTVTLVYDVKYERASGTEALGVFFPRGEPTGRIRAHRFNSDALTP